MSARRVRRMIGYRTWRRYKRIAVIRNPYDRLVSMFWWRQSVTRRAELAARTFAEVQDAFYGCRDFEVIDTDGHHLVFGKVLDDAAKETAA